MPCQLQHRALYAAFDRFPSRKGSAVHIDRFARALFAEAGGGLLYTLGGGGLPPHQREGEVEVVRLSAEVPNLIERARGFALRLDALLDEQRDSLRLCHFRDPWGGIAVVSRPRDYAVVYEVNGLPSIELPYLRPAVPEPALDDLRALEDECLKGADLVVVPSHTIRAALRARGVPDAKVEVVPNGADLDPPAPRPESAPARYVLYFGALQPWQGVAALLRAFALLRDLEDLSLVICASGHRRRAKRYVKFTAKLGVAERVVWRFDLPEEELAGWRQHAQLSVVPLAQCSRNLEQGCAPLKILESMASGVPVVASDLPAVRELMIDGEHGRLVDPDRPSELARAIRLLLDHPEAASTMGRRAREHVGERFTWERSTARLRELYRGLGLRAPQPAVAS